MPALSFFLWSQVLIQDVSIAHAIQGQETQESHVLAEKSLTRVLIECTVHRRIIS